MSHPLIRINHVKWRQSLRSKYVIVRTFQHTDAYIHYSKIYNYFRFKGKLIKFSYMYNSFYSWT